MNVFCVVFQGAIKTETNSPRRIRHVKKVRSFNTYIPFYRCLNIHLHLYYHEYFTGCFLLMCISNQDYPSIGCIQTFDVNFLPSCHSSVLIRHIANRCVCLVIQSTLLNRSWLWCRFWMCHWFVFPSTKQYKTVFQSQRLQELSPLCFCTQ